jgi:hypothetical protein
MNGDLIAWLRAQIDEDERVALAVTVDRPGPWVVEDPPRHPTDHPVIISEPRKADRGRDYDVLNNVWHGDVAAHVITWDPARALAEVKAKRAALNLEFYYASCLDSESGCCHEPEEIAAGQCPILSDLEDFPLLLALAQPYAGRPGWNEAWAVEA